MIHVLSKLNFVFIILFVSISSSQAVEKTAVFSGVKETEYPKWFKEGFLDLNEDVAEAAQQNKRLMLIFHQPGCPYCNALVERNLAQIDIEQDVRKNFDVIAINMWGDREIINIGSQVFTEKSFAAALKVQFTPTILFFNEQGKVELRLNGYLPPDRFKIAINWAANKQPNKQSYRLQVAKYNLNKTTTNSKARLIAEPFFQKAPYDLSRLLNNKNNKPFALFFEQKECPNCRLLHDKVLSEKSTQKLVSQFSVIQLDMWANTPITDIKGLKTTARQLANKYDVKYAPTIIVFNSKGTEIIRSEAFFKTFHTQGIFHYVLSGSYKKQPSFQRYLSLRAEHFIDTGINVDIWGYLGNNFPDTKK